MFELLKKIIEDKETPQKNKLNEQFITSLTNRLLQKFYHNPEYYIIFEIYNKEKEENENLVKSEIYNFISEKIYKNLNYFSERIEKGDLCDEIGFEKLINRMFENYVEDITSKNPEKKLFFAIRKILIGCYGIKKNIKIDDEILIDKNKIKNFENDRIPQKPQLRGSKQLFKTKDLQNYIDYLIYKEKGRVSIRKIMNELNYAFSHVVNIIDNEQEKGKYDISEHEIIKITEEMDWNFYCKEFESIFNEYEKKILSKFLQDITIVKIAEELKTSPQNIQFYVKKIEKKIKEFVTKNSLSCDDFKNILKNCKIK
ncbi:MAG: hypothetical protein ABIN00_07940 [candidate division WOR-3 bacterium]